MDAVWELRDDGELRGHLTTAVIPMRSFPVLWVQRDWLWSQVIWLDGRRELEEEDYGPDWAVLTDLERERFEYLPRDGGEPRWFDAAALQGRAREEWWSRLGPPV